MHTAWVLLQFASVCFALQHTTVRSAIGGVRPDAGVVIVGGGFGGLYTALKLRALSPTTQVKLVDPKDHFVFLPLLYELAVGSASAIEVAPLYQDLLRGTGIEFVRGSVTGVDLERKSLTINTGGGDQDDQVSGLGFEQLVLACGAQPNLDIVPGAREFAMPFCRVEDAYRLKAALNPKMVQKSDPFQVVVLGGGFSGVELASTLADFSVSASQNSPPSRPSVQVSIIDRHPSVLHSSSEYNRQTAACELSRRNVLVYNNATVDRVIEEGVWYSQRSELSSESQPQPLPSLRFQKADLVIATLGMQHAPLLDLLAGVDRETSTGRVFVDRTLRSSSNPSLFALGDCACIKGSYIPSTAQAAMQQSEIVCHNLLAVRGELADTNSLLKFSFVPLGEMLTLGSKAGIVNAFGGVLKAKGLAASVGRRLIYALRMPTPEQRLNALLSSSLVMGANELDRFLNRGAPRKEKL